MKWVFLIIILALIGLLSIPMLNKKEKEPEPFVTEKEAPAEKPEEPVQKPEEVIEVKTEGAQFGDLLKINYVLSLEDGTVVDTNNETLAKQYEIGTYIKGPYTFILGQSDKIYGRQVKAKPFDDAIKGLEVGDKKTLSIQPTEKVIAFDIPINDKRQRRMPIPTVQRFPKETYENVFGKQPTVGDIASNPDKYPWPYQVLNVTDRSVYAKINLKNGDEVVLPGTEWKSQALDVGTKVITFVQNPKIGQEITTPYGTATITNITLGQILMTHKPELGKIFEQKLTAGEETGMMFDFIVNEITEETFTIRRTNYLQQEHLKLYVEMLDIVEDVKKIS